MELPLSQVQLISSQQGKQTQVLVPQNWFYLQCKRTQIRKENKDQNNTLGVGYQTVIINKTVLLTNGLQWHIK